MTATRNVTIGVKQFRVPSLARSEVCSPIVSGIATVLRRSSLTLIIPRHKSTPTLSPLNSSNRSQRSTLSFIIRIRRRRICLQQFGISAHREGDLKLGSSVFELFKTPGVRPEAICVRGWGVVFSGRLFGRASLRDSECPDPMLKLCGRVCSD